MRRQIDKTVLASLSLVIAIGLCLARTEKIWAQNLNAIHTGQIQLSNRHEGHAPFDPRRVPQSGGAASRLLAGIAVKHG